MHRKQVLMTRLLLVLYTITTASAFQALLPGFSCFPTVERNFRTDHHCASNRQRTTFLNSDRGNGRYPTSKGRRRRPGNQNSPKQRAIQRNKKLVALGRASKWQELLAIYKQEGRDFNSINYSTLMNQLGRASRRVDRRYPVLGDLLDDIAQIIETRGVKWFGIQSCSNIAHAIGKLGLKGATSERVMKGFENNSLWLVEESNPQNIANTAWAFATLGVKAPKLLSEVERQSHHASNIIPTEKKLIVSMDDNVGLPSDLLLRGEEQISNDDVVNKGDVWMSRTVTELKEEIGRRNVIRQHQGLRRIPKSGNKRTLVDRLLTDHSSNVSGGSKTGSTNAVNDGGAETS